MQMQCHQLVVMMPASVHVMVAALVRVRELVAAVALEDVVIPARVLVWAHVTPPVEMYANKCIF